MIPYLFHIYGPLYINCYGIAIVIGILALCALAERDAKIKELIKQTELINIIIFSTFIGIIGGALLWGINNWDTLNSWTEIFMIWQGGFSLLGTIICISIAAPLYLRLKNIPVLPLIDRLVIYAPLTQAISRIGCFCAGCCYGKPTNSMLGIIYTHTNSCAPLNIKIHPTQLYSSLFLFFIFLFMYFIAQKYFKKAGQLFSIYLILVCIERFGIDFIRQEESYFSFQTIKIFTSNQIISLIIILVGFSLLTYYSYIGKRENYNR